MKKGIMDLGHNLIAVCTCIVILLGGCVTTEQNSKQSIGSAVSSGDVVAVKHLIASGVDVNTELGSFSGLPPTSTPLLIAVSEGNVEMVTLLVSNGANVNQLTGGGVTPLGLASQLGRKDIVEILLKSKTADVNGISTLGATPLHEAAKAGHRDVAEILIQQGANVNVQVTRWKMQYRITDQKGTRIEEREAAIWSSALEPKGITPLGLALKYGRAETAEYLRSVGAKE